MQIMVVDNDKVALDETVGCIKELFHQPEIEVVEYQNPMFALQYLSQNPKEVALLFSAVQMQRVDGFELAEATRKISPGTAIFFTVQAENPELAWLSWHRFGITCLPKPLVLDTLREATAFLFEPCNWENQNCEEGCSWEWCGHKMQKKTV